MHRSLSGQPCPALIRVNQSWLLQTVSSGYAIQIVWEHCQPTLMSRINKRSVDMLDMEVSPTQNQPSSFVDYSHAPTRPLPQRDLETLLQACPLHRRRVRAGQSVFRTGQSRKSLHLIHAGFFKTCVLSEDGREKITGFRMHGDVLGIDALDMPTYACDAIALDAGEIWELPYARLCSELPEFQQKITSLLAGEIRRDWSWMLAIGTLSAQQRVVAFLLDLADRLKALGFSARALLLHMTRAELGNFLALQLETVTRALSDLQARGLIGVERREIQIEDPDGLRAVLNGTRRCH
jgi:CRP/FNR family transcriptional regulator